VTDRKPVKDQEQRMADLAPELHNDEQDDHLSQAQEVAGEALNRAGETSPLDSIKVNRGIDDNSAQDLVDRMRDMEQSGRIDMGAYLGEPNMDDNEDKYGEDNKLDDLPGDGTTESHDPAEGMNEEEDELDDLDDGYEEES
jgi:hypothetical protein